MKKHMLLAGASAAIAVLAMAFAGASHAQNFPSRPITFVVPAGATGASTDLVARKLAKALEPHIKQSVIVENKPGAGTYIGNEYVARAAPDGYTLLVNAMGGLHSNIFVKGQALNPAKELTPIAPVVDAPVFIVVPSQLGVSDLKSFIGLVKASPMKYNIATSLGSGLYLDTMSFLGDNGMSMTVIPYSNFAEVMPAMGRNEYHMFVGSMSSFKNFADQGLVRPLAVAAERRLPLMPNVPTAKEQGVNFVNATEWMVFGPLKMPPQVVKTLNEAILAAMREPEIAGFFEKLGFLHTPATPAQLAARQAKQHATLAAAAQKAGVQPK